MLLDFIKRRHDIINERLEKVFYIFGADQPEYHRFAQHNPDVTFSPLYNAEMLVPNSLIIFDDFGQTISSSPSMNALMTHLVTKCVNHDRISIIIVLHHLYGKNLRTISLSQVSERFIYYGVEIYISTLCVGLLCDFFLSPRCVNRQYSLQANISRQGEVSARCVHIRNS